MAGGTLPYSYLWTPGGYTTPTTSNLTEGIYSLLQGRQLEDGTNRNYLYLGMMKRILFILYILPFLSLGQSINSISIHPTHPTSNDTIFLVSQFTFYGNCSAGMINAPINQSGSTITVSPEYCGYGGFTLCYSTDTIVIGILTSGSYQINIEYHQGTVCGGSFDTIIANYDTSFQVATVTGIEIAKDQWNIQSHKKLLNIYDLLGRPSLPVPNQILFYQYSDGSVEKRIQLDSKF